MSIIITATDFSELANHAVHYACQMAAENQSSVVVVHSYIIPVAFNDNPMPVIPLDESKAIAETSMEKLIAGLKSEYKNTDIKGEVMYGDITQNLKDYLKETNPWLVVVGNSSVDNEYSWLGSSLLNTLRHLPCPVIAVPTKASYTSNMNICFACDYKNIAEAMPAEKIINLITSTGSKLHILNVDHENKNYSAETPYEAQQLHEMLRDINPEYHHVNHDDIDEGILNFVQINNMDMLIVTPHKHNFFESLFHKSHTKALIQKCTVPVVAVHDIK